MNRRWENWVLGCLVAGVLGVAGCSSAPGPVGAADEGRTLELRQAAAARTAATTEPVVVAVR